MADLNLILTFKIDAENDLRVKSASRIMIGRGGLTLTEPHTGAKRTLALSQMEVLSIKSVTGLRL